MMTSIRRLFLSCLLPLILTSCTRDRPGASQEPRVDTVMTFIAEGVRSFPQIEDSSRLQSDGSFRSKPGGPPCRSELSSKTWPATRVGLGPDDRDTLTIRLPPTLKLTPVRSSSWLVWVEDTSVVARRGSFRVSVREGTVGYPMLRTDGTRDQTQIDECVLQTKSGPIAVALFTIAWRDSTKPDQPYVVAYWEPRPGLPVQISATGIGPTVQPTFLAGLRSIRHIRH